MLGYLTAAGEGVPEDDGEALRLFALAAEEGDAVISHHVGAILDRGGLVPPDAAGAVRWYRRAAEEGIARAMYEMVDKNTSLLPVVRGGSIVGVLRSVDVLSEIAIILGP